MGLEGDRAAYGWSERYSAAAREGEGGHICHLCHKGQRHMISPQPQTGG